MHPHRSVILLGMTDMVENKTVVIILENAYHSMTCMLVPDIKIKGHFCIQQQCSHQNVSKGNTVYLVSPLKNYQHYVNSPPDMSALIFQCNELQA